MYRIFPGEIPDLLSTNYIPGSPSSPPILTQIVISQGKETIPAKKNLNGKQTGLKNIRSKFSPIRTQNSSEGGT